MNDDITRSTALTHIARPPLPWRDSGKTVCGQPISQYADGRVVGLADAHAMLRRLGQPARLRPHSGSAMTRQAKHEARATAALVTEMLDTQPETCNTPD